MIQKTTCAITNRSWPITPKQRSQSIGSSILSGRLSSCIDLTVLHTQSVANTTAASRRLPFYWTDSPSTWRVFLRPPIIFRTKAATRPCLSATLLIVQLLRKQHRPLHFHDRVGE